MKKEDSFFEKKSEYIDKRLKNQQSWHSQKSKEFKRKYKVFITVEIICASLLPIMSVCSNVKIKNIFIPALSSIILLSSTFLGYNNYHELWIEYRKISEALKREYYLYKANADIYRFLDEKDAFNQLVINVENILAVQNNNWERVVSKVDKEKVTDAIIENQAKEDKIH